MLIRGLVVLVIIWAAVFGVVKLAGSMKPTASKVNRYLTKFSLAEVTDPEERLKKIDEVAQLLNQLEVSELNKLREEMEVDPRRELFEQLSPEEQLYFFEKRAGRAFEQLMQSFNEMERDERKRIVERALSQMQNDDNRRPQRERLEEENPELVDKMAEAGFKAYYSEADAETKIDLAPLMEEMQRAMSRMGGRR
ncbi:MAG: hypothetical protein CMO61_11655 [Verrucomicrobiales bacterium]|jgi:DNA invertase Pin-like site-specific DNA recombinase|nr:hypothetical protein [Verrucomicrobiales bacterium]|tara:strand:- start:4267 stop:4851 length:585 start_codon:yes stop_codon:yes gene_type:complete